MCQSTTKKEKRTEKKIGARLKKRKNKKRQKHTGCLDSHMHACRLHRGAARCGASCSSSSGLFPSLRFELRPLHLMAPSWAVSSTSTLLCLSLLPPSFSDIGLGQFNNPDMPLLWPWSHSSESRPGIFCGYSVRPLCRSRPLSCIVDQCLSPLWLLPTRLFWGTMPLGC